MFCCKTNKRPKLNTEPAELLQKSVTVQSINDEAVVADHTKIQKLMTMPSNIVDPLTQSRSNSTSRTGECLTQSVPKINCKKTPFMNYKNRTNKSKFISSKAGFTMLVTHIA